MNITRWLAAALVLILAASARAAAPPDLSSLDWQVGPATADLGDIGSIRIPDGYAFLGSKDTARFMTMTENIANGDEYLLAPKDLSWFATFEFNDTGYIKDNEKIDADSLLQSVKEGTEQSNKVRRKKGWGTLSIVGWRFKPQYDEKSHLLEWAFLAKDDKTGNPVANYNTRVLGRTGVMSVTVAADPQSLDTAIGQFKKVVSGYQFADGKRYAQYKPGDKVAEYGLAALIAGGAAAVATKKGFFSVIGAALAAGWKFLLAGLAAAGAAIRKMFGKKA